MRRRVVVQKSDNVPLRSRGARVSGSAQTDPGLVHVSGTSASSPAEGVLIAWAVVNHHDLKARVFQRGERLDAAGKGRGTMAGAHDD
jgi:hypothetical protein